eukprot:m.97323 g.97323  ORF g.97323 m.97323 type:complete len:759 (+) comp26966_c1_seq2:238-2514(+)
MSAARPHSSWPMPLLDDFVSWAAKPLPKDWLWIELLAGNKKLPMFLNVKEKFGQWEHPAKTKYACKLDELPTIVSITHKHKPGDKKHAVLMPIYPQPPGLEAGWTQIVSIPPKFNPKKKIVTLFAEVAYANGDGVIQPSDPTVVKEAEGFPDGWTAEYDEEGDEYFLNRNDVIVTYDDPRIFPAPVPSKILELTGEATINNQKQRRRTSFKAKTVKIWTLGERDGDAFEALNFGLVSRYDLPEYAQTKIHNRYLDIVPNLSTMVTLPMLNDDPATTYVNANYVQGYSGTTLNPKKFIAAMGPLPTTIDSFWRMIINEKVQNVVMVTNLFEKGRKKCEKYFPVQHGQKQSFGEITIVNTTRVQMKGFIFNHLDVTWPGGQTTIKHWWFNTWPDHDVPRDDDGQVYTESLLNLVDAVKKSETDPNAPVLVHCSAGVGRTGTFISIHSGQVELEMKNETDPLSTIEGLRTQRPAMVQHLSQFYFVHDALARYCELKEREVFVRGEVGGDYDGEDDENVFGSDQQETAQSRKNLRLKEKEAARSRKDQYLASLKSGTLRKIFRPESSSHGEISVKPIRFKGNIYHFNDVNGDGVVDWKEAQLDNYPRELFDLIAEGKEEITLPLFLKFGSKLATEQTKEARRRRTSTILEEPQHAEHDRPWYAGSVAMSAAVASVKVSGRADFLVRRSTSKPDEYHIIACIINSRDAKDAGKWVIKFNKETTKYVFNNRSYDSLEKIVKECKAASRLSDNEGAFKLKNPIVL